MGLQALGEVRESSARWEGQTQELLAQTEHLKDLLHESAAWGEPPRSVPKMMLGVGGLSDRALERRPSREHLGRASEISG